LKRLALGLAGAAALAVTMAIYLLRLDRVAGLLVDDAWYVLLAKALATGHGYTLINSPTPGITPFYPPGFPALLSLFYRLSPQFPENVWLLKSVSIAAMIAAGLVAFRYFERHRSLPTGVAIALAFAIAIYPALVFLATSSVMSECVFLLAQLATIVLIERAVKDDPRARSSWLRVAAAGATASFAFLTRSFGVGLLLAVAIYLVKEKRLKQALVFAAVVAVAAGPWMIYARTHVPTAEQRVEQSGSIVLPYTDQFWNRVAGRPMSGTIAWEDLPGRVWQNLSEVGKADFGAFVFYSAYRPVEPGETVRLSGEAVVISLLFAVLALVGYGAALRERMSLAEIVTPLALAISVLWGWEQYRLLLPLVPFFLLYLLLGVRSIVRVARLDEAIPLLAVSGVFVVGGLEANYRYIQRKYDPVSVNRTRWIRAFEENEAFFRHVGAHVPPSETIAADNPALLNLYTGHKTIASMNPAARWRVWNRIGVRYYARTSAYLVELDGYESRYPTIHRSDGILELQLLDLGEPASRRAWGEE
jgi:hypothetical protein